MTALPHQPAMSVEEYFRLDQSSPEARYEYIDGYVTMLAGGTLDHVTISANVHRCLYQALRGGPCICFPVASVYEDTIIPEYDAEI